MTAAPWHAYAPKPRSILVVEDHELLRETLCECLHEMGFRVTSAPDGCQGIELARQEYFDLILMDLQMPVRSGLEATRAIRSETMNAGTWIVALTGNDSHADRSACRQAGLDGLIPKGIGGIEFLFDTIQSLLRTPRSSYRNGQIPAIAW